jgi:hypothetical protein
MMSWPIGWSSLEEMPCEQMSEWEYRTKGSPADVSRICLRSVWWDNDPSETPYRPRSYEQLARERDGSLPILPQDRAYEGGGLGPRGGSRGDMRHLLNCVSSETESQGDVVRQPCLFEREGETISKVEVGGVNQAHRLKAIGNGQVPIVAGVAFQQLSRLLLEKKHAPT